MKATAALWIGSQITRQISRQCRRYFSHLYSNFPNTEEELYKSSSKTLAYVSENSAWGAKCFELTQKHFPNAWGFMWGAKKTHLSSTLVSRSWPEREKVYQQLASKDFTQLRGTLNEQEQAHVATEGLLIVGGEDGKTLISEAFRYLGIPTLISCKNDLVFLDLRNKVPLGWIIREAPAAFNVHPAPPEMPGAGCYIPSLIAGEKLYAVTAHIMTSDVDAGPIMFVKCFPIPEGATRTQLYHLTSYNALQVMEELLLRVKFTDSLEEMPTTCHVSWGGKEITRRDIRKVEEELAAVHGAGGHPALR